MSKNLTFAVATLIVLGLLALGCRPRAGHEAVTDSAEDTRGTEPHWSYEGDTGPDRWGSLSEAWATCATGREQSPVDIVVDEQAALPDLTIAYQPAALDIEHDGHTVEVAAAPESTLTVSERVYQLVQLHFHSPSEHTVSGRSFPLELHLVHRDANGNSAVVGVLFEEGASHPALAVLVSNLPKAHQRVSVAGATIQPAGFLPGDLRYVRYDGSLTTPPCDENVAWHVLTTTVAASPEQLAALAAAIPNTNRPVQAIGSRTLVEDAD